MLNRLRYPAKLRQRVNAIVREHMFDLRICSTTSTCSWNLTAIPAAIRIVKREGIDVVLTTSPPSSVHFVGAAVKRATGIPWVADLRDSLIAHPHRRGDERRLARIKEQGEHGVAGWSPATPTRSSPPPTRSPRRHVGSSRKAAC